MLLSLAYCLSNNAYHLCPGLSCRRHKDVKAVQRSCQTCRWRKSKTGLCHRERERERERESACVRACARARLALVFSCPSRRSTTSTTVEAGTCHYSTARVEKGRDVSVCVCVHASVRARAHTHTHTHTEKGDVRGTEEREREREVGGGVGQVYLVSQSRLTHGYVWTHGCSKMSTDEDSRVVIKDGWRRVCVCVCVYARVRV